MAMKIRKGDLVQMLAGKDRGKQGRVLDARPSESSVIVENLNLATRHRKPRPIRDGSRMGGTQMTPGGMVDMPTAVPVGNVMIVCPTCKLPTRIGYTTGKTTARRIKVPRLQAPRLRSGDRPVSPKTAAAEAYAPRLKQRYNDELRSALKDELERLLDHAGAPGHEDHAQHGRRRGEDRREGARQRDRRAVDDRRPACAGRAARASRSRSSSSAKGMPIGCRVTLRGDRMWEFLDRLISIALPRIRDFRGLNPGSFDGRGNYSLGIREQIIFPEIDYDSIKEIRGLDVAITTSAETDEQAEALLRGLGLPLAAEEQGS